MHTNLGNSPGDHRDSFEERCAREVFRQLVFLLECLRKEFCWLKRMKYKVGVICPVCCHKRLVSYCPIHHKQDCEREECLHFISESELRNANQSITCTRSPVAVNNKVYKKDFSAWFVGPSGEVTVVLCFMFSTLYVLRKGFLFPSVERLIFGDKYGCCKSDASSPIIRDL